SLAEADLADFRQQPLEVVLAQEAAVFHALTIQHIALDCALAKNTSRPLAELRCAYGVDPVADGNDGGEDVESHRRGHPPLALLLNYPEFPDSCLRRELMTGKDVLQVLADGAHIHPEQFGHQLLRQPQGFVLIAGLDALFAGLASED